MKFWKRQSALVTETKQWLISGGGGQGVELGVREFGGSENVLHSDFGGSHTEVHTVNNHLLSHLESLWGLYINYPA